MAVSSPRAMRITAARSASNAAMFALGAINLYAGSRPLDETPGSYSLYASIVATVPSGRCEFRHLDIAQVGLAARELCIVIKEVPLALELDDGVVVRPAQHRFENLPPHREWTVRRGPRRVHDEVRVAGRVQK